jgi:hypothetical protein
MHYKFVLQSLFVYLNEIGNESLSQQCTYLEAQN